MLFSLLFTSLALAQEDAGSGVLTKAPVLLQQVEPVFPPELIDAGLSGTATQIPQLTRPGEV